MTEVVEHKEGRSLQVLDAVLLKEAASDEPLETTRFAAQDSKRAQVPQRHHQIAGRNAMSTARVVSKGVNGIEMKRVTSIRGVEQRGCETGSNQSVH